MIGTLGWTKNVQLTMRLKPFSYSYKIFVAEIDRMIEKGDEYDLSSKDVADKGLGILPRLRGVRSDRNFEPRLGDARVLVRTKFAAGLRRGF